VTGLVALTSASARSSDPGHRTTRPVDTLVVGVPNGSMESMTFTKRLPGLDTDRAVWRAIGEHPDYVAVDSAFGSTGGPPGDYYGPGDTFTVTDLRTGMAEEKTIAGVLSNAQAFYSPLTPTSFPVVTSAQAVEAEFGPAARVASGLVGTAAGVSPEQLGKRLQAGYLSSSLVSTPLADSVRRLFDGSRAFFQLMEGFLALGLLVGITGLGVVMVRAVRERRRTIGILRALGFRSSTIQRSFVLESGFVALEGILLGSVLGVLTSWLMYEKSAAFAGIRTGFPVMWLTVSLMGLVTLVASLLATLGPARRAARIAPAIATRVSD
jgi:putative ABC transport system permease protein